MNNGVGDFSPARLVGARRGRGITQRSLGESVDRSANTIRGYENGDRTPPRDIESALCRALGVADDALRVEHVEQAADYHAAVRLVTADDAHAATVAVLLPRSRRPVRRHDAEQSELARVRAEIERLRADPGHREHVAGAPPLSDAARSIVALAWAAPRYRTMPGGDAA